MTGRKRVVLIIGVMAGGILGWAGRWKAREERRPGSPVMIVERMPSGAAPLLPPDLGGSVNPVERAVADGMVLESRISWIGETGRWERLRLVKSPVQPGLVRVIEEWISDGEGGWDCLSRNMYLADQLIVRVRHGAGSEELGELLSPLGMRVKSLISEGLFTVLLPDDSLDAVPEGMAALGGLPDLVEAMEPDGVGFGGGTPNDPRFSDQWGLRNTAQFGGVAGADVDAAKFWDIMTMAPGIVIAVLDSGLNFTHPDLLNLAWANPGEVADGFDNDGNGRADDIRGWDFVDADNNPVDDHGHGSNVSGIIAATRNNATGGSGLIGGVKILSCKILNASGSGTTSNLISGTAYARLRGAPVFNLSLQNYPSSSALSTEFTLCANAGILLVICAGNQGVNNDITPNYPSSYTHANIIAVGGHGMADTRWAGSFNPSNYGAASVDLFAPGTDILAPVLGSAYDYYTGTSQATGFVTAVAAAMKSVNPAWKAAEIKSSILSSVIKRTAYSTSSSAGGRLSAVAAIGNAICKLPDRDTDVDGAGNLLEYLAGRRIDSASEKPAWSHGATSGFLSLSMPRVVRADARLVIERSEDLEVWTEEGVVDASSPSQLIGRIPISGERGFLRIKPLPAP